MVKPKADSDAAITVISTETINIIMLLCRRNVKEKFKSKLKRSISSDINIWMRLDLLVTNPYNPNINIR
jgi:hypothetical protein